MTSLEIVQKSIEYIEENLKCNLTLQEVSDAMGYSVYHFTRLFNYYVGMPVSAYITKRRLQHIIYETQLSKKLVDTALLYGFDTYAGFYKAFKREYGCTPTKYLKINSVKKPVVINLYKEANIMLTQTQIKQYLKNWGIDNNVEIHPTFIAGGRKISNNAWSIDDKYIFKTGKNIAGLKTHIYISNALTDLGIESSYPTATRDGKGFIIDEERYFILLNKIKGQPLTNEERFKGNRLEIGKKYGEAIGNLHKAFLLQDDNLEVDNTDMLNLMLRWALPETKKILEQWGCLLPEEFYKDYIEYISNYFDKLPKQIIHRDPNPSNILFKDNEVTGFIDFEISERNVRIIDPCYCATGILSETDDIERDFNYWIEILDGIIMGYDNICSLTEIEKQSIPYIIYSIQMIFIAWLNGKEEYKNLAIKNRNILLKIFKYFQNKNTI